MFEKLDDSNFMLYAAKHYDNPGCLDTEEFYEDLARIKYLRKLFKRYTESGDLKYRLILNHLIILNNVFGPEATCRMLFLKLDGFYPYLKPFLILIGILPDVVRGIGTEGINIHSDTITLDTNVVSILRAL